jgi:N-acetylneuraminate synthase
VVESIQAGKRTIGTNSPCFIIAEAGVNHNGDVGMAKRLVDVAAEAGADAVKFQSFRAEGVASADAPKAEYQHATTDVSESQLEMLKRLELSPDAHRELMGYCRSRGILFMSTPFDEGSADLLAELGVAIVKVPSGEVSNLPFLSHIASKGRPVILSTGMSYLGEVDRAVRTIQEAGNDEIILLHCVSNYPADPTYINLRAMRTMASAFQLPVGYSDHTEGIEIPLAAVAMGACVIEKHITLDRNLPGPDQSSSMEPAAFRALVAGIRAVEKALGDGRKQPAPSEAETRRVIRRSLALRRDLEEGHIFQRGDLTALRPASGITPDCVELVIGRRLSRSLSAGSLLTWQDLA